MSWTPTGLAEAGVPRTSPRELLLRDRPILLVRVGETIFAVDAICPHLGGLLADGSVEGARLTCPLHGAVFDVTSGAVAADPFGLVPPEGGVEPLRAYPVRVREGMVEVDVPEGPVP